MKKIIIVFSLISLFLFAGCSKDLMLNYEKYPRGGNPYDPMGPASPDDEEPGSWLVMVYLDAANNLEGAGVSDVNEMIEGSKGAADLTIIVLMDRMDGFSTGSIDQDAGDWKGTKLYKIQNGTLTVLNGININGKTPNGTTGQDLNMGDPVTLRDFIDYCVNNYTADYVLLDIWNHGGGWRSEEETEDYKDIRKPICWDDESAGDTLYMSEVSSALGNSALTEKIAIIYMDACLMQMVEVCFELQNLGTYLVASEETVPGDGGDYVDILSRYKTIKSQNATTPYRFSYEIVASYRNQYASTSDTTLSCIDLRKIRTLTSALDTFAENVMKVSVSKLKSIRSKTKHFTYPDQADLYDFAELCDQEVSGGVKGASSVRDAINNILTKEYHHSSLDNKAYGISVYFPNDTSKVDAGYYNNSYNLLFTDSGNNWVSFIEWWDGK